MMGRLAGAWLLSLLLAVAAAAAAVGEPETKVQSSYIVHVVPGRSPRPRLLSGAYTSFLRDQLPTHLHEPEPMLHYSYEHAATGFAARLTGRQAEHLASLPSVLAVVPDKLRRPHTTLTPSFLGLVRKLPGGVLLPSSNAASDVVIGVIDSGVYPKDRASFAAHPSMTAPPAKFRGGCVSAPSFNASAYCNNKLVGAKFFFKGYEAEFGPIAEALKSPLDTDGHGTHTASIAAGSAVAGASFFSYAKGRAVGMAPGARIAAYKVIWKNGASLDSDILAAFDEAIKDGVDVISFSIGPDDVEPKLYQDGSAVAAFNAVRKGIVVSACAGNEGPGASTVKNTAPWFITVGASTINRQFTATAVLGNGETFTGASLYSGGPAPLGGEAKIPLVFSTDAGSQFCEPGKLNASFVSGKVVLCDEAGTHSAQGEAVRLAGGVGAILTTLKAYGEYTTPSPHILPATSMTYPDAVKIFTYIKTETSPVATIVFNGTIVDRTPSSPRMASFSSRGPNPQVPEIFKPDVTAPGVDILAAWTGESSPDEDIENDTRRVQFSIKSGTSMACPHVSGIAAMLRHARPKWSPAAIKSALMTTAYNVDNAGDIIKDMSTSEASTPFVRGAGHVDPNRALNPGLVYDAGADDYISFLCALGYTSKQIAIFTRDGSETDCSKCKGSVGDFNYPAFSVVFNSDRKAVRQRRVVRDVRREFIQGYSVQVTSPAGVHVTVRPQLLLFSATQRTRRYEVTFTPLQRVNMTEKHTFGSIVWSDGKHKLTSPIAITWPVREHGEVGGNVMQQLYV